MSSGIFVSYRRQDVPMAAGRLADDLKQVFGERQIFRDVETIEPGEDFVLVLGRALDACAVMLAVIGPKWLTLADAQGRRRLDDPADWTRLEISAALARNVRVVPVLVEGARMPEADELPEELKSLARRQALELSDKTWKSDVSRLLAVIGKIIPMPPGPPRPDDKGHRKIMLGAGAALAVMVVLGLAYEEHDPSSSTQPALPAVPAPANLASADYSGAWSDGVPGKNIVFRQHGNLLEILVSIGNATIGRGTGTVAGSNVNIVHDDWSAGVTVRHNCQFAAAADARRLLGSCMNTATGYAMAVSLYR